VLLTGPQTQRTREVNRLASRLLKVLGVLFVIGLALFSAGAAYVISLPGVGDAQTRVREILASHHGIYSAAPPPRKLGDAVVSVEDEHFYSNFVINVADGFGRAALATLDASQDPGGSTIQQQLAKQLYGHGSGLIAAFQEIGLGVKLSLSYSKAQILAMYLNAVYYGNGYWGDVAAARGYFGKNPAALNWAQAAMLAGLPQAPSAYDPLTHYALARQRQRHVLDQLAVNHYLTQAQADAAFRQPLQLR
jgi:membrane peptidoglycan carboxypeptidase